MSRSRNIKPGFFKNEVLAELCPEFRLLFVGLWTYADREGRFEYRPRRIRAEILPYDDSVSVEDGIAALADSGFLEIYEVSGQILGQIKNWAKHQNPHHKEIGSTLPGPPGHVDTVCADYIPLSNTIRQRIYARDGRKCRQCGAEHGLSIDHILPVSRGGNSIDDNLQVLCLACNCRKGNRISSNTDGRAVHESCMSHGSIMEIASCPTDSGFLIPDSLNLIPDPLQKQEPGADAPEVPKANEPELPPEPPAEPPHNRLTDYPPPQVKDPLWHTGLAFLQKKSIPEDQARKFLGKLKREIGDIRAGALLAEAEAQDITDPIPWLSASAMKAKNTPAVGKTMQALQALEALKDGLAHSGNSDGISKTALLEFGADTGGGGSTGNGRRLG